MMAVSGIRRALLLAIAPAVWACGGRDEPAVGTTPGTEIGTEAVRVTNVDLGSSVGADNRVAAGASTTDFRTTDTVHAAVTTEGTARGASLTARWTYQDGQVVDETTQPVAGTGTAVTNFRVSMPQGFPPGDYQVEILLNNSRVESRSFRVR
jgi:hypothetical protein